MIEYDDAPGYQPGVCNIGPAEIQRRRRSGYAGIGAALGLAITLLAVRAPAWTRLAVAAPLAVGIMGFMQARCKFCVGYALSGRQNMGELGEEQIIEDEAARQADRRRALAMQLVATTGGLIAGLLFWRAKV